MMALSIRQPWASLILKAGKDIEIPLDQLHDSRLQPRTVYRDIEAMAEVKQVKDDAGCAVERDPRTTDLFAAATA